jgi:hypothetical protein
MEAKIHNSFLVILFALSFFLSACLPTTLPQQTTASALIKTKTATLASTAALTASPSPTGTPTATVTSTLFPTTTPILPFAQDLALITKDLGDGWVLAAEKTDLKEIYYLDRDEEGEAIIRTEEKGYAFWLDPALIDSINMRGFSQPEQNLVLFQVVVVFKDAARAEEEMKMFMPGCDPPCEEASSYDDGSGDRGVYRDVSIGDEAVLGITGDTLEEYFPFLNFLFFRTGRVLAVVFSIGQLDDLTNALPMDESRLEELARILDAKIP